MENINIVGNKCNGCGVCSFICPFKAIEMKEDNEGFLYPNINQEKCKNCGACLKKCNVINKLEKETNSQKCYMAITKNKVIYKNSASGGIATLLSKLIIEKYNGVVYGCNMDNCFNVKHIRVDSVKDLYKLQDSKYVQSTIYNTFNEILNDLKVRKVLFIGTPCQVNSLKQFTNEKNRDNLITCDLICHGVPSPGMFKKYIAYLEKKYKSKIKKYRFRNKSQYDKCGFRGKIIYLNLKKRYFYTETDVYYNDFLQEKNYRKSCYDCKYKTLNRVGDITLGDVNTWEKYYDFYPELTSSLVILNNNQAEELFSELKEEVYFREISLNREKELNKALNKQTLYPKEREKIYNYYNDFATYEKKIKKEINISKKIKIVVKTIIPYKIRIMAKKILKRRKYEQI